MRKAKSIGIVAVFAVLIFGLALAQLLTPDQQISTAERRKLQQAPEITAEKVFSSEFSGELEEYLLDQFPLRDQWRSIKARLRFDVFRQKDNNGVYLVDGQVSKLEYPLQENKLLYAAGKISEVCETYLQGMNVYYAVVPDKNYFMAEENGYPSMDYARLMELLQASVPDALTYIDLFSVLSLEDYYRTDTHWRQECIYPVAEKLAQAMGAGDALTPLQDYQAHTLSPFYGVYCGQSALAVEPDELVYLSSALTDGAVVTSVEQEGILPVYTTEKFGGMDGYDVFLSGAQAIVTIEVPDAQTERELILFRDSYGSSLAPLLCGAYSKITLIDLRYVAASYIGQFVDFADQDVLFLYSTSLLNSGTLLK